MSENDEKPGGVGVQTTTVFRIVMRFRPHQAYTKLPFDLDGLCSFTTQTYGRFVPVMTFVGLASFTDIINYISNLFIRQVIPGINMLYGFPFDDHFFLEDDLDGRCRSFIR
jgi:hypothetical protein